MKRITKIVLTLVITLSVTLTLVSCGGGKVKVQGITEDKIIIGNTAATEGVFAGVGVPFNLAMQVVFDEYNAARAAGERKIEFKHYNDNFVGEEGLTHTKTLVEEDKVFALVGHFGTNTVEATMDYLLESGVPMVYGVTGVNSLYFEKSKGNNILSVQPIYRTEGQIIVARALSEKLFGANQDAKLDSSAKIAVMYSEDDAGNSMKIGVEEELKAKNAFDRATFIPFKVETAATAVDTALGLNPGVILLVANQGPSTAAATALRQKDAKVPVLTSYVNSAATFTPAMSVVDEVTQALPYNVYANAWVDITDPTAPAPTAEQVGGDGTLEGFAFPLTFLPGFTAEYWQYVKLMNDSSRVSGTMSAKALWANPYGMAGYVAAKTFVMLLEKVDNFDKLTWESFIALAEKEPMKLPLAGTIDWTEGKRHGLADLALTRLDYTPNIAFNKIRDVANKDQIYG